MMARGGSDDGVFGVVKEDLGFGGGLEALGVGGVGR